MLTDSDPASTASYRPHSTRWLAWSSFLLAVLGMVYLTAKRDHERMILDCRGGSRAMRLGKCECRPAPAAPQRLSPTLRRRSVIICFGYARVDIFRLEACTEFAKPIEGGPFEKGMDTPASDVGC
jgi:hypothetical protein